ncbi:MAG: hypothetical protein ACI9W6_000258 [Motiliproteus sp.]|jgi:hypothetical protein
MAEMNLNVDKVGFGSLISAIILKPVNTMYYRV